MNNKKGFTLVELIAVIAILAVLVLVALPNVLGVFNKSIEEVMKIEETQAVDATTLYIRDNCGRTAQNKEKRVNCRATINQNTLANNEVYFCLSTVQAEKYIDEIKYKGNTRCDGIIVYDYNAEEVLFKNGKTYLSCENGLYVTPGYEKYKEKIEKCIGTQIAVVDPNPEPDPPPVAISEPIHLPTYTINYHNVEDAKNSNPTVYDMTSNFELENASKYCFDFLGWYKESTFNTRINSISLGSSGDLDLYAKWDESEECKSSKSTSLPSDFNIIYHNVEGALNDNPSSYNTVNSTTLKNAKKPCYNFEGWYRESNFKTKVTTINAGETGDIDLYAKWSDISPVYVKSDGNDSNIGNKSNPFSSINQAYTCKADTIVLLSDIVASNTASFSTSNKTVTLKSSNNNKFTIKRSNALLSSIINLNDGTLNINSIIFDGNNINSNMSMIVSNKSKINIDNSTFIKGITTTTDNGGALYFNNTEATINNSLFSNNEAINSSLGGGGAMVVAGSNIKINNTNFFSNSATKFAGALLSWDCNIELDSVKIENNNVTFQNDPKASGGGIYYGLINNPSILKIRNSSISNNTSSQGAGGGILFALATPTVTGNIEIDNSNINNNSSQYGGGFSIGTHEGYTFTNKQLDIYINNSNILNNTANIGGGFYIAYTNLTINNGKINENTASLGYCYGGAGYSAPNSYSTINQIGIGEVINNNPNTIIRDAINCK